MNLELRKNKAREALKNGMSTKEVIKRYHLSPMAVGGMRTAINRKANGGWTPAAMKKAELSPDLGDPDFREVGTKKPTLMERLILVEKNVEIALDESNKARDLADRCAKEIGLDA